MKGQQIVKCTQCDSNRVQPQHLGLIFFIAGGCMLWIPFIGLLIGPILLLLSVIMPFTKGKAFKCIECKHGFTVTNEQYRDYKKQINH